MKYLVLDNYDSFVYNLVHMLRELQAPKIEIRKNDQIDLDEVTGFDKILLSPGPGIPSEAGIMPKLIKRFSSTKNILGVCLGHQAIAEHFGVDLINLKAPKHGVATTMQCSKEDYLFQELPKTIVIGHYHSWVVHPELNGDLESLGHDSEGHVMALRHKEYDVRGVQFHPESILTQGGLQMIKNWMDQPIKSTL